jgi:hypothetical protein
MKAPLQGSVWPIIVLIPMRAGVLSDNPKVVAAQYNVVHYLSHFRSGHTILVPSTIITVLAGTPPTRCNCVIRLKYRLACKGRCAILLILRIHT